MTNLTDVPFDDVSWERVVELEARINWIYTKLPYGEYLRTAHWQRMRELALEYYGRSCSICHTTRRLHVHHRLGYWKDRGRGQERLCDLTILCAKHHDWVHALEEAA